MKLKVLILSIVAAGLAGACGQPGMFMERKINGKTVGEIFSDPKVAALAKAACAGDKKGVARQVAAGVDPNTEGYVGAVPLLWAIRCHSASGVEALLKAGADPNHLMDGDFSPVYAAADEPVDILRVLLKHGGDPNASSKESENSALMLAMSMGIDMDKWENYYTLLDAGADINKDYGSFGTIARFAAVMAQYDKLIELLNRGYNHDLTGLGRTLYARVVLADLEPKRAEVKAMLEARGVKFPLPPPPRPAPPKPG